MLLAVFLIACAAVFPVQLFLCFRGRKNWIKMIPLMWIAVNIVCCMTAIWLSETGYMQPDEQLAALIALFIGLSLVVLDGLAWLTWGIANLIQNRKNILSVCRKNT